MLTGWVGRAVVLAIAMAIGGMARNIHAQQAVTAAEGKTSLLTTTFSGLTIEPKESAVSVVFSSGRSTIEDRFFSNTQISLVAEKGKRDLLSKGELVPGFSFDHRFIRSRYSPDAKKMLAVYVGVGAEIAQQKLADSSNGTSISIRTYERVARNFSGSLGINWRPVGMPDNLTRAPTLLEILKASTIGVQYKLGAGTNLSTAKQPSSVCTLVVQGTNAKGRETSVQECQQRLFGSVHDATNGQLRIDVNTGRLFRVVQPGAKAPGPMYSLIGAFSRDFERGIASAYNLALGPAIYPPMQSERVLGAILFELTDLTNARKESPRFSDKFSIRLYVGVPF